MGYLPEFWTHLSNIFVFRFVLKIHKVFFELDDNKSIIFLLTNDDYKALEEGFKHVILKYEIILVND